MGAFVSQRGLAIGLAVSFFMLTGCKGVTGQSDVTGSIASPTQDAYRKLAETWGKRYQANPGDKMASLHYARALRGMDERMQAVSVLQQAAARNPDDPDILAAYGKALIEAGQLEQARTVLSRAYTPDMPNARVMSAQAVIADQSGEHARAQELYRSALKQDPNDPVILTNLGLSLMLSKQPRDAEATLRRAIASPRADARMRETLALALIINGKSEEAVSVLGVDMPMPNARQKAAELQANAAGEGLTTTVKAAQTAEPPLRGVATVQKPAPAKPALRAGNIEGLAPKPVASVPAKAPDAAPLPLRSALPEG